MSAVRRDWDRPGYDTECAAALSANNLEFNMTWSLSLSAPSRAAAKVALTLELPKQMLQQKPHARDFDLVRNAITAAIDACEEGAVTVTATGHVNTDWAEPVPKLSGVTLGMNVYSTPAV